MGGSRAVGFFDRLRGDDRPPAGRQATQRQVMPVVGDTDLAKASELITRFGLALDVGNEDVWNVCRAIALAGGAQTEQETLKLAYAGSRLANDPDLDRPWRWLAAVAREARERDDPLLPAQVFVFLRVWAGIIAPTLALGDIQEIGMGPVGTTVQAHIASEGFVSLAVLDPDQPVLQGRDDPSYSAESLLPWCAEALVDLAERGAAIPPELLDLAKQQLSAS